jgi:hypothetical protein
LLKEVPIAPVFYLYERTIVKPHVKNLIENPRAIFRTRWLELDRKVEAQTPSSEGGGFWGWLSSWFSPEAWSKWWNS